MSIRSPIRTTSPATVTLARSAGAAMTSSLLWADAGTVAAASRAVASRSDAKRHDRLPQRNSAEVVCSIWSAALITLAFIS